MDPRRTYQKVTGFFFFTALEEEINKAEMEGKSILIPMDANSKLSKHIIEMDPHDQSIVAF